MMTYKLIKFYSSAPTTREISYLCKQSFNTLTIHLETVWAETGMWGRLVEMKDLTLSFSEMNSLKVSALLNNGKDIFLDPTICYFVYMYMAQTSSYPCD